MSNLIHNSTSIVSRDMNQQFKQNENEKVENNTYVYDELKWNAEPLYCPLSHPTSEGSDAKATLQDTGSTQDHKGPSFQTESQNQSLASDIASAIPIHAETTALLIVDVQPEYWSSCPSVRKDFPDFETNLARTLKTAREKRCKVIWVRANYRRETSPWLAQFERLSRNKRPDAIVELHCDPDDEEFGWEPFATPEGGEAIIAKSSWSSTTDTALIEILRASAIDTVLVCGLITSVCVQHSAFGVFEAGYRTLLVEDACGDRGRARHEAALALYGGYMYELIRSSELADPNDARHMRTARPVWFSVEDSLHVGVGGKNTRTIRSRSSSVSITSSSGGRMKRKEIRDRSSDNGDTKIRPCVYMDQDNEHGTRAVKKRKVSNDGSNSNSNEAILKNAHSDSCHNGSIPRVDSTVSVISFKEIKITPCICMGEDNEHDAVKKQKISYERSNGNRNEAMSKNSHSDSGHNGTLPRVESTVSVISISG